MNTSSILQAEQHTTYEHKLYIASETTYRI
jgi:hypothetical protein